MHCSLMLGELPALSVRILDIARERGRVAISLASKAIGAGRNTIKDHVRALTESRRLVRRGAGSGLWYSLA